MRLSGDERSLLRSSARAALRRQDWPAAAREVLDGAAHRDFWPIALQAGWPGLLLGAEAGGAGLGAAEALLLLREQGRELAGVPLFGHLAATALMASSSAPVGDVAGGTRRVVWLPARPEAGGISVDAVAGGRRPPGPRVDAEGRVTATVGWVPDAPGADLLATSATDSQGRRWTVVVAAAAARIEEVAAYDSSRRHGHVHLDAAPAELFAAPRGAVEANWALAQALLGAECLGAAERLLEMTLAHARARFAFGRAIGSFQAIKHQLVEVLRRIDNGRALADRAAAALDAGESEAPMLACALRFSAGGALDVASRRAIAVHGGMGATWEHPAALYFRRAQVARRLLAGHEAAAAEVGRRLLGASR